MVATIPKGVYTMKDRFVIIKENARKISFLILLRMEKGSIIFVPLC